MMKYEKIKLSNDIILYKYNLDYDKQSIMDEVYMTIDIYDRTLIDAPNYPGTQTDLIIKNGEWDSIAKKCCNIILNDFYNNLQTKYVVNNWLFLSNSNNNRTAFHHHIKMKSIKLEGQWTYTFYAQMPDNLKNDDGILQFKDDDDNVYSILPNEGDFYVFDAKYLHAPKTNTSSNKERVVLAGTISEVDPSKYRRKTSSTLM